MNAQRILLVAAENGALPGGKVGGVADVMRDLPPALAAQGSELTVLTPAYGLFNQLPNARPLEPLQVPFGGVAHSAELWQLADANPQITHLAIEHPLLSPQGPGKIYCNDGPDRPFATDAGKFAFFSAAVAALVQRQDAMPNVVHLHDWHAALYLLLRNFDPAFRRLQAPRTVFTIHNLAYQGIRPLANDASSLEAWFPGLALPPAVVRDPRYADCVNPMAVAIRLADKLNTVSPTYAEEILQPNDPERGFSGGEGLEQDLRMAAEQGRLVGILNGCDYPATRPRRPGWNRLLGIADEALSAWEKTTPAGEHAASREQLKALPRRRPGLVLTSIGRLTAQKCALFLQPTTAGRSALEAILDELGRKGVLILLGSGEPELEQRMQQLAAEHRNFIFLCGYSDALSQTLYEAGDFFLMPSSFEPCGISQMLAMRAGQPCIAHAVGGLRDTIRSGQNGFLFGGDTPMAQADNFVATVQRACRMKTDMPERWQSMRAAARAERFDWSVAAERYQVELYGPG